MPTYDYKCNMCGYRFELFQSMGDEPKKECPSCGGSLKRLIGKGAGPIFKGSGFYQTDYKNPPVKNSTSPANKPTDTKAPENPASSSKPETKAANLEKGE